MTATITPRGHLQRREIYSGVARVLSDGAVLSLVRPLDLGTPMTVSMALSTVAEIALDEDSGAID